MSNANEVRKFVRELVKAGWVKENGGNGHIRVTHPSGQAITISRSPSDWRWKRNAQADVKRINEGRMRSGQRFSDPQAVG